MKVGEARGLGFEAEGGLLVELFAEQVQAVAGERDIVRGNASRSRCGGADELAVG